MQVAPLTAVTGRPRIYAAITRFQAAAQMRQGVDPGGSSSSRETMTARAGTTPAMSARLILIPVRVQSLQWPESSDDWFSEAPSPPAVTVEVTALQRPDGGGPGE